MIEELHARDLALIRETRISFAPGLTVLTGETGAGKTALVGALKLVMGARADSGAVRDGAEGALVEAVLEASGPCLEELRASGIDAGDGILVVRRRVGADGRSRCYLNDEASTVGTLAATAGSLIDLHGQHEHQSLLSPATHLAYLDRWAQDSVAGPKTRYLDALAEYRRAAAELEQARQAGKASSYQLEQARFVCSQIDAVSPGEREYDELEERLPVLRNGEALASGASEALAAIGGEGQAAELASFAQGVIERLARTDPALGELSERLANAACELEDIALELRAYRDDVEFDPLALQEALDRLGALDGLVRRFGPTYPDMLAEWERSRALIEAADESGGRVEMLERACAKARADLERVARELEDARSEAAKRFCVRLSEDVGDLAMEGASFGFSTDDLDFETWGPSGSRRYELVYAPAAGVSPRPLAKIASGGELSRVMLAIECLFDAGPDGKTLVFDEVDAGIGGVTAHAVARRIADLSTRHQVVVVTHLAQIAARAERHLLVEKKGIEDGVRTTIRPIEGEERVAEIARMLSGTCDDRALDHARSLLSGGGTSAVSASGPGEGDAK